MLYPPTNSSILVFSTFAHLPPTNYLACSFLILIFYYNHPEKPKNIILNPHSCASFNSAVLSFYPHSCNSFNSCWNNKFSVVRFVLFSPLIHGHKKKESFWLANVILLLVKRTRFAVQKDSFYNAKGLLCTPKVVLLGGKEALNRKKRDEILWENLY